MHTGEYTLFHSKYFATQLALKRPSSRIESLATSLDGARGDLNSHQIDEVGLGKTIEAGIVIAQYWAERKRKIFIIVPASLRNQWRGEINLIGR